LYNKIDFTNYILDRKIYNIKLYYRLYRSRYNFERICNINYIIDCTIYNIILHFRLNNL